MNRVIVLLTALGLLVVPSAAVRSGATITVLQLNICHGGMAGCYRGDAALTRAAEVIRSSEPQVLSVNEACSGDVARLRPAMGNARALFVAARNLDGTPVRCRDGDQRYGNIIMVADSFGDHRGESGTYTAQYTAADGHRELRSWGCLRTPALHACTTHLSADHAPTALAQCRDLLRRAAGFPGPAVVVGDLNLTEHGSPSIRRCDPPGFSRGGDGAVQHLYAGEDLSLRGIRRLDMAGTTDHPGLVVTLCLEPPVSRALT
ncbi:endonuclease/exonuclease/phosphatase family protein [Actinophytocola xanthii]|uniref:Endonuclease/exonuclease/phosphatase domain-containing protein n=1 Tax=Actinophytocola xanthii TaxID=1912961 RepID=A0A1Q8CDQ1_9PSEU|nr:endonuclease/exonuclease/phosphatase family protein [Actinophytocola xanthii]OLF12504.1 hypothetical protein BU204_28770 [Actinophytocola xanthii]